MLLYVDLLVASSKFVAIMFGRGTVVKNSLLGVVLEQVLIVY